MKLKDRLSSSLTTMTALVLGASFVAAHTLVQREETGDLDHALLTQATVAVYLAQQRDAGAAAPGDRAKAQPPAPRYEAVYGPDGQLRSASPFFLHQAPRYESFRLPVNLPDEGVFVDFVALREPLRGIFLPVPGSDSRLLFALSRQAIDDDLRFLAEVFVGLFLATTGLAALFSRWLGARVSSDVDALASVTRAVAGGDLAARVGQRAHGSDELVALGADIDHMITQLAALVTSQQTFVSHAAHELRSPLATLRGQLQLALRRPRSADEYRSAIEECLDSVNMMISLSEDLLVLARLQSKVAPRAPATALDGAIEDALRMSRGLADERRISLDLEPLPETLILGARADAARALRNIIDNAIKHSPEGSSVSIRTSIEGDFACIFVEDQGPGVSPQDAEHIFAPFFRGDKEQADAGAGLGLAIVRELVRSVGGSVALVSGKGPGACFVLRWPLAAR